MFRLSVFFQNRDRIFQEVLLGYSMMRVLEVDVTNHHHHHHFIIHLIIIHSPIHFKSICLLRMKKIKLYVSKLMTISKLNFKWVFFSKEINSELKCHLELIQLELGHIPHF